MVFFNGTAAAAPPTLNTRTQRQRQTFWSSLLPWQCIISHSAVQPSKLVMSTLIPRFPIHSALMERGDGRGRRSCCCSCCFSRIRSRVCPKGQRPPAPVPWPTGFLLLAARSNHDLFWTPSHTRAKTCSSSSSSCSLYSNPGSS